MSDETMTNEQMLRSAAHAGDIEKIKSLLAAGVDVNAKNEEHLDETALMEAALNGHSEAVQVLLDAGAKNRGGVTALMYAAGKGNSEAVQTLLGAGTDVNARDESGATALMRAAEKGDIAIIKQLLDAGADVNIATGSDGDGMTAIKFAAESGKTDVVQVLQQAGATGEVSADPDKELLEQAQQGDEQALESLLDSLHDYLLIGDAFAEWWWSDCNDEIQEQENIFGSERYNRVLAAFLDEAENGDAIAQYAVGRLFYQWGNGFEEHTHYPDIYPKRLGWYCKARDWLDRACDEHDHAGAAYWLGIQNELGRGTTESAEIAVQFYCQAAQGGYAGGTKDALECVCDLLTEFREIDEDFYDSYVDYVYDQADEGEPVALAYIREEAENGDAYAMSRILAGILENELAEQFLPLLVNMEADGNADTHSILFGEGYETEYLNDFDGVFEQGSETWQAMRDALKIAAEEDCDWSEESRTTVLDWLHKRAEAEVDWAADILSGVAGSAGSGEDGD